MRRFEVVIPGLTVSALNVREHHMARHRRVQAERRKTMLLVRPEMRPLLVVTLTRVSPRQLDDDNLRGALKSVRDGVAARLRIDDGSPLVRWEYGQERGEPGVRVVIEEVAA